MGDHLIVKRGYDRGCCAEIFLLLLSMNQIKNKHGGGCGGDDLCSLFALAIVLLIFIVASLSFTFLGFAQESI